MSALEIARIALLVVHLVGSAAIVGSFILQMPWRERFDFSPLLVGSIVQVASGCALVAVRRIGDMPVLEAKMVVKLGLALVVLALVVVALVQQRRLRAAGASDSRLRPLLYVAGFTAIADIAVAAAWT
ncbi:hypothetical protein [Puerhibacterium puerhi]|uniref:hypothetical protein n=1 Tax=Puerhibacterium puerhi TaxID=2692623 RepID=UPI0013569129|nr:hypothetical protein [Puerhibacterium puerhi]